MVGRADGAGRYRGQQRGRDGGQPERYGWRHHPGLSGHVGDSLPRGKERDRPDEAARLQAAALFRRQPETAGAGRWPKGKVLEGAYEGRFACFCIPQRVQHLFRECLR